MPISENNKRVMITLDKNLHEKIKELADKDRRSVSNFISLILERFVQHEEELRTMFAKHDTQ
jgi:metal-responsive CopG/Arc/MetJ family transcriptional regulator